MLYRKSAEGVDIPGTEEYPMNVSKILGSAEETLLSLEVYPPKTAPTSHGPSIQKQLSNIFETVEHLMKYEPAFVSVTYNPEGGTKATSIPLAAILKQRFPIESVAHLTSIAMPRGELRRTLEVIDYFDIDNILALRGDRPRNFTPSPDGLMYASELVAAIREHKRDFCIGVAGYPEGHPECTFESGERDLERDLGHFKDKVSLGADFAITQLFLENQHYFDYVGRTRRMGMDIPILPGIMPIVNHNTLAIVTKLCGATIPVSLERKMNNNKDDPEELFAIGVDHAIKQCKGLLDRVPCIHFYTMDRWEPVETIIEGFI